MKSIRKLLCLILVLVFASSFFHVAMADPTPVVDSVTGKTWLEDRDRLRAQWLNGNLQALFNWANGNITSDNIASGGITGDSFASNSIPLSKIDYASGLHIETFTATSGQTLFPLSNSYTTGENRVEVFVNGIRQTTITETSSMSISLDGVALGGWEVTVILH